MQTIIALRHGAYDTKGNEALTPAGRRQVEAKAMLIASIVGNRSVCICSSSVRRAHESALIVAELLKASIVIEPLLNERVTPGFEEIARLLQPHEHADVVILVAHKEQIIMALAFFAERDFINAPDISQIPFAGTVVIDTVKGESRFI